jgi:hypothetical protein
MTTCPSEPPPPADCDLFLGCGCVETGEKCTIADSARQCSAAGEGVQGEGCALESDCALGHMCVAWSGATSCRAFCDVTHPCGEGDGCYLRIIDDSAPPADLALVCAQVCGLIDQDCELPGQGCYESSRVDAAERGVCASAGAGAQGDECAEHVDCAAGFLCINPDGPTGSACAALCDRSDADPGCAAGACSALPDHQQTGVCLTP